jgi:hypothetical protein
MERAATSENTRDQHERANATERRTRVVHSQKGPYISGFISPSKNISFLIDSERLLVGSDLR